MDQINRQERKHHNPQGRVNSSETMDYEAAIGFKRIEWFWLYICHYKSADDKEKVDAHIAEPKPTGRNPVGTHGFVLPKPYMKTDYCNGSQSPQHLDISDLLDAGGAASGSMVTGGFFVHGHRDHVTLAHKPCELFLDPLTSP